MIQKILVIVKKELLDHLREYRAWLIGLILPSILLLLIAVVFGRLISNLSEQVEEPLALPVSGAENAPNLLAFLTQQNVTIEPAPPDPKAAVIAGDIHVALIIPAEYNEKFSSGQPAAVQIIYDSSRTLAAIDITRIKKLVEAYNFYIGTLRLSVRGVSPQVIEVVQIENIDTATPQSRALMLFSFLPFMAITAIFNGAVAFIIDATAGERERESLEPLLINPLPRGWFAIGKMIAAMPFALLGLVTTLATFALMIPLMSLNELNNLQISFKAESVMTIVLLCLPVVVLACAIQTLIASFTKTAKEANSYLPFVLLIVSLPGMVLPFLPIKPTLWMMLIPILSQQILMNQILRAEPIAATTILLASLMTILPAILISLIAVKLYESEQIIAR